MLESKVIWGILNFWGNDFSNISAAKGHFLCCCSLVAGINFFRSITSSTTLSYHLACLLLFGYHTQWVYWPRFHGISSFVDFLSYFLLEASHSFWMGHEDSSLVEEILAYPLDEEWIGNENQEWPLDKNQLPHQAGAQAVALTLE